MGTSLTGQTQSSTYDALLKITDNGPLTGSLAVVTDGLGNDSALKISTAGVQSTGTLAVTGATTLSGTLGVTGVTSLAAGAVGAPGLYLAADTTTGLYRIGANNVGLAISGVKLLDLASASVGITGALTVSTTLGVTGVATFTGTPTGAGITALFASPPAIGGTAAAAVSATTLSASSTLTVTGAISGAGVTALFASPPAIGGTAPAAVTGTTLTDSKGEIRLIPQNSKSAAYTTVLADAGKHIFHPTADVTARTFTIDSNANVAYPIGTAITFVNQHGAGVVTIAITADTMRLAGAGTTGSRTLAADNVATALKVTSTEWIISGSSGLT